MTDPKDYDEHAKSKAWQLPMSMPTVGKGAYNNTVSQSTGTKEKKSRTPKTEKK